MLLVFTFVFTSLCQPVYAKSSDMTEFEKMEAIEKIFAELDDICITEKLIDYLKENNLQLNYSQESISQLKEKEQILEAELESLNVHKMDPKNEKDLKILKELSKSSVYPTYVTSNSITTQDIPPAPDLAAIADLYSLYYYDGTYKSTYPYRYIRVIDNKNYNGLYRIKNFKPFPDNPLPSLIRDFIEYSIEYIITELVGKIYGGFASYSIGALFPLLNDPDSSIAPAPDEVFYEVVGHSVTDMTYYYVYDGSGWRMIGSEADFRYQQVDQVYCNLNGNPYSDIKTTDYSGYSSSWAWYQYLDNWIDYHNIGYDDYCAIHPIGSFTIQGYNNKLRFTPAFADYPLYLL